MSKGVMVRCPHAFAYVMYFLELMLANIMFFAQLMLDWCFGAHNDCHCTIQTI